MVKSDSECSEALEKKVEENIDAATEYKMDRSLYEDDERTIIKVTCNDRSYKPKKLWFALF